MKPRSSTTTPARSGPDRAAVGPPPHGHQDLVEPVRRGRLGPLEPDRQPVRPRLHLDHLGGQVDRLVLLGDPLEQRRHQVLVGTGDELVQQLDHGELGAELGVDGGHLQPDDAAADHQQPLGDAAQLQGAGGVDHPLVLVRDERQGHRLRATGDDCLLEADHGPRPVVGGDLEVVGGRERAHPGHHLDLALVGQAGQAVGEPADHPLLPGAELVEVDGRLAEGQPVLGHLLGLGDHPGRMQQGLGGDAADVQADPAQDRGAVHQHHGLAQVGGPEGGAVAARPGPEHQHLGQDVGLEARRRGRRRRGRRRRDRLGGGRLLGGGRRGLLLAGLELDDDVALGHRVADRDPQPGHCAAGGRGHVHGRLVRLQGDERVLGRDGVAGRHVDLDHRHVPVVTDVGHPDLEALVHPGG
jgi:hypothetical protein